MDVKNLDQAAWERWVAYRKAIKKELKPISLLAAATKLSGYGNDQAAVVDQSISNQWQGLFDLKKKTVVYGEKLEKTDKQKQVEVDLLASANARSEKAWSYIEPNPIGKLKLLDALLSRYCATQNYEKMEWLIETVGMHLRTADAATVLGDPSLKSMVRQLFSEAGVNRLKERAAV